MKFLPALLVTVCATLPLGAGEVTVYYEAMGIHVPVPEGYESIPESDPVFKDAARVTSQAGNDLLALFLGPPRAKDLPDVRREFSVQANKAISGKDMSKVEFASARRALEGQRILPKTSSAQGSDAQTITTDPMHDFSDRHFSIVNHIRSSDGRESCGVSTVALIRGRGWYLTVSTSYSATAEDIEWAKSISKAWVSSLIAANPPDAATREKEEWLPEQPLTTKIVQGLVMLLVFFVIYKFVKKKPPGSL